MRALTISISMLACFISSLAMAGDTVKIKTGGHTIEFPCSEIADDTDLSCDEFCAEINAQDGVSCEVVDGIMYVETDVWLSQIAIERAVSNSETEEPKPTPSETPSRR